MGACLSSNFGCLADGYFSRELIWAVYGFIQALENTGNKSYLDLARGWQTWLDYTKKTAAEVWLVFSVFFRSVRLTNFTR